MFLELFAYFCPDSDIITFFRESNITRIDPNIRQCFFFLEIHLNTLFYIPGLDFDMSIIHPQQ